MKHTVTWWKWMTLASWLVMVMFLNSCNQPPGSQVQNEKPPAAAPAPEKQSVGSTSVYIIEKVTGPIVLDGNGTDFGFRDGLHIWHAPQYVVMDRKDQWLLGGTPWSGMKDLSAKTVLQMDDNAIYFLAEVVDDQPLEHDPNKNVIDNDSLELFLSLVPRDRKIDDYGYGSNDYQLVINPGNGQAIKPGVSVRKKVGASFVMKPLENPEIGVKKTLLTLEGNQVPGYVVEARFPLELFAPFKPMPGERITFNLVVNDRDGTMLKHGALNGREGASSSVEGWVSGFVYKASEGKLEALGTLNLGDLPNAWEGAPNLLISKDLIPEDQRARDIHIWDMNLAVKDNAFGRERICLNGVWACQYFAELPTNLANAGWFYSVLPRLIQDDKSHPCLEQKGDRVELNLVSKKGLDGKGYIFERQFTLPDSWRGSQVMLNMGQRTDFEGARRLFYYRVYVNSRPVSPWKDYSDLQVYLTNSINWTGTNRLTIVKLGFPEKDRATEPLGDMWLVRLNAWETPVTPAVEDAFIITSVQSNTLAIEIKIKPETRLDERWKLGAEIYDWNTSNKVYEIPVAPLKAIQKKENGYFRITGSWKDPVCWSPDNPKLYVARIVLKDKQDRLYGGNATVRFGFREIMIQGKDVLLNGYPLKFNITMPIINRSFSYQALQNFKNQGFNALFLFEGTTEIMLNWMDELGLMMIQIPGGGAYGRKDMKNPARIQHMIQMRNHPALVFWVGIVSCAAFRGDIYGYWVWNFHKIGADYYPDLVPQAHAMKANCDDVLAFLQKADPSRPVFVYCGGSLGPIESTMSHCDFGLPLQEAGGQAETWARQKTAKPYISLESWVYPGTGLNVEKAHRAYDKTHKQKIEKAFTSNEDTEWVLLAEEGAQYLGDDAYRLVDAYRSFPSKILRGIWDRPVETTRTTHWILDGNDHQSGDSWPDVLRTYSVLNLKLLELGFWEHARAERGYGITGQWHHFTERYTFMVSPSGEYLKDGINRNFSSWYQPLATLKLPWLRWDTLTRPGPYGWDRWTSDCLPDAMPYRDELRAALPPDPYSAVAAKANAPLMLFIGGGPGEWNFRRKDHAYFTGEPIRKQVVCVNDLERNISLDVRWELRNRAGNAPLISGSVPVQVERGKVGKFPLEILWASNISAVATSVVMPLRCCLVIQGRDPVSGKQYEDSLNIELWNIDKAPGVTSKILVYDEKGITEALLAKAGLKAEKVESLDKIGGAELLIIGRESLSGKLDGKSLSSAIAGGLKVLVLEQGRESILGPWLKEINLRNQFIITANHPVLKGLQNNDFAQWRDESDMTAPYPESEPALEYSSYSMQVWPKWGNEGMVCTFPLRRPQYGNFRVLLSGGFDMEYAGLVEYFQGKGVILFCQLDLTSRFGKDPVATRLLHQMLNYLAAYQPASKGSVAYAGRVQEQNLLAQLGVNLAAGTDPGQAKVLAIGPDTPKEVASPWLELVAEQGKTMLLLWTDENADLSWLPFPLKVGKKTDIYKTMITPEEQQHPLLNGISSGDLYWRFKRAAPVVTGVPKTGTILAGGLVAEIPHGKGKIIVYQINPDAHVKERSFTKSIRLLSSVLNNLGVDLRTKLRLTTPALELSQRKWKFRTDIKNEGLKGGWANPQYDDAAWRELLVGKSWESQGITEENPSTLNYPNTAYNGIAWYRIRVTIPETYAKRALRLVIGSIRGSDTTFCNGKEIGKTTETGSWDDIFWCAARDYALPTDAIQPGENVIAVRVDGQQGPGGMTGWPARIMAADGPVGTVLAPMDKDTHPYDPYRFVQW